MNCVVCLKIVCFCYSDVAAVGDSNGSEGESQSMPNKDMSSFYQDQRVQQPCHLSSSIYYGGQDIYSYPPSTQSPGFNSMVRVFVCFAFCFFLLKNCWFYHLTLWIRFFKNFPRNNANTVCELWTWDSSSLSLSLSRILEIPVDYGWS